MLNSKELQARIADARAAGRRAEIIDGGGLILDVTPAGCMTWRYRYRLNGQREKFTIGAYPEIGLADARIIHKKLVGAVADGRSPVRDHQQKTQAERAKRLAGTVADLATRYQANLTERGRKADAVTWHVDAYILPALGSIKSGELTAEDVRGMCGKIKASGAASSAREVLGTTRRLLQLGVDAGVIASNVAAGIKPMLYATKEARERSLSPDELRALQIALDGGRVSPVVSAALRFILLTMARKNEALKAPWTEIDLEAAMWQLPPARTKNSRPHVVPLSTHAVDILKAQRVDSVYSEWVFPGIGGKPLGDTTLNESLTRTKWLGLDRFTVHDLRRTGSTLMHEQGWNSDVIEKALNHTMRGVRGIYNRAEYLDQRREMLQAWADYLDALKTGAKVLPLHRRAGAREAS